MFENKQINGYTYATRYIASWIREGGQLRYYNDLKLFKEWLRSLGLNEEDVTHILILAENGKMELEHSARKFIEEHSK